MKFWLFVLITTAQFSIGLSAQESFSWAPCRTDVDFANHGSMTVVYMEGTEYRYREKTEKDPGIDILVFMDDSKPPSACSAFFKPIIQNGKFEKVNEQWCTDEGRPVAVDKRVDDLPKILREQFLYMRAQAMACREHSRRLN